jgi:ATP/maltotriose-dependent transcriptional regulator MalT
MDHHGVRRRPSVPAAVCAATARWIDVNENLAPFQSDGSALDHRPATDPAQTIGGIRSPFATPSTLSLREREVLGYAPSMLSAAEIGMELFVSVNTVKAHLKSIYRKLGVTRRRDAVAEARRLGLL